ncbi:MAG: hypothetical protein Q8P22_13900 [Chloroflexota bacterium]|nr:hypothetical protein [Chloroflexota bacterium]
MKPALLLALAIVVVGSLSTGGVLAARYVSGLGGDEQARPAPTPTPSGPLAPATGPQWDFPSPTPGPPTATPSPLSPQLEPTVGGTSPPGTEVPSPAPRSVSGVTLEGVQQTGDGRYYVPDRGDGCYYVEVWRAELEGELWVGLQAPDCSEAGDLVWEFDPVTGEMRPVLIRGEPPWGQEGPLPLAVPPSFFQQRPDGTYFRADAGDGCSYEEVARYTRDGKERIVLQSPTCGPALLVALDTWDTRLLFAFRPPDLTPPPTPLALRWPNPFPTAEEVEIGPDGKYIIRHRADGCDYDEDQGQQRTTTPDGRLWILLRSPECSPVGLLVPGRQTDVEVMPIPTPPPAVIPGVPMEKRPDPQEIRQDSEGKYFVPDRGDRCVWTEQQRLTLTPLRGEEHMVAFLYSEECQPDFYFWYDLADQLIIAYERYVPEGQPLPAPLWPLSLALEDIQQDEAGKYFVPPRADGCAYREQGRAVIDGKTWVMLSAPGCYLLLWRFAPATDELFAMEPGWWPIREMPSPSDFKLDSDGNYYLADRGDGCPWRERRRFVEDHPDDEKHPQHLIVHLTSDCITGGAFYWYDVTAGQVSVVIS